MSPLSIRGRATSAAALAGLALFVAACGSSSSGTGSGAAASAPGYGAAAASAPASGSARASTSTHGKARVATAQGPLGTYLTDASGRALYEWAADSRGASVCSGACAQAWPPLLTKGAPAVTGGAKSGALGTFKRSDGSVQVTYDGHPLYYYIGDTRPHQTTGQGSNGFGAAWWLLTPAGTAITQ